MRRSFIVFILFCICLRVVGQYVSPGTGVSWTLADLVQFSGGAVTTQNNTYLVNQALTISTNDTLKVSDNQTILVGSGLLITINGVLIINPPQMVVIKPSVEGLFFRGFRFENSHASVLRKTLIEYGGGIRINTSNMLIEECTIRFFDKSNTTGAIQLTGGKTRLINNQIYQNQGPGIASAANVLAAPIIAWNNIYNNNTSNANTPQINLGNSGNDTIRILNNTINGQYDNTGGIAISTLAGGNGRSIIEGNLINNNRYGIAILGNNQAGMIRNNIITNNNIQGNPDLGGSGINLNGAATNQMIISGNTISGNLWGITVQGTALPNMGEPATNPNSPGGNYIFNNKNNRITYALYNNTPQNLKAQNNYWGSYNLDTVEMYIVHQPDNPALGMVDYMPILLPTDAGAELSSLNDFVVIKRVFPNPFRNKFFIEINELLIPGETFINSLHDISGSTIPIFRQQISSNIVEFKAPSIKPGVYLLKVVKGKHIEVKKVIAR